MFADVSVLALFLSHPISPQMSMSSVRLMASIHQSGVHLYQEELSFIPRGKVADGHFVFAAFPLSTFCYFAVYRLYTTAIGHPLLQVQQIGSISVCRCDYGSILIQPDRESHGGDLVLPEMERRVMSTNSHWKLSHKAVAMTTSPAPPAPAYEHSENAFHPYNNPSSLSSAAVHQHYLHPHLEMKKLWLRVVRLLLYKRDRAWILAQMCLKLEPWLDMPFTFFSPEILKGSGMYIFVSTQCAINVVQVNECVNEWASFSESVSLFVR